MTRSWPEENKEMWHFLHTPVYRLPCETLNHTSPSTSLHCPGQNFCVLRPSGPHTARWIPRRWSALSAKPPSAPLLSISEHEQARADPTFTLSACSCIDKISPLVPQVFIYSSTLEKQLNSTPFLFLSSFFTYIYTPFLHITYIFFLIFNVHRCEVLGELSLWNNGLNIFHQKPQNGVLKMSPGSEQNLLIIDFRILASSKMDFVCINIKQNWR